MRFGVFHRAVTGRQPLANFFGVVGKGAVAASISDVSLFIEDIEAFRPGGVGVIGGVVHVVDAEGDRVVVTLDEIVGDGQSVR